MVQYQSGMLYKQYIKERSNMRKIMTEQTDKLKLKVEIERNTKKYTVDEIKDAIIVVTDRERTADEVIAVLETEL